MDILVRENQLTLNKNSSNIIGKYDLPQYDPEGFNFFQNYTYLNIFFSIPLYLIDRVYLVVYF